jgi:hypothetical protein
MIYKKTPVFLFAAILFFGAVSFVQAQPKDLIVIVDTSTAMSQHYANVTGYLTGVFLRENLELGDTFHLISFAGKPRFELARRIIDEGDVRTINGRIFLLYPLEPVSDLQSAVSYGERYLGVIPQGRQKKVFIIGAGDGESVVNASAARLPGVDIRYLKVPLAGGARPPAGQPATQPPAAANQPAVSQPSRQQAPPAASSARPPAGQPATQPPAAANQPAVSQPSRQQVPPAASSAQSPAGQPATQSPAAANQPPVNQPPPVADGSAPLPVPAVPETGQEVQPTERPAFSYSGSVPLPALVGGGLLLLALIGLAIILTLRRLGSSPNKVMAAANAAAVPGSDSARNGADLLNSFARTKPPASQAVKTRLYHRDNPNQFLSNPPLLSLFVEDQNTAIGRRNVHALKAGNRFTIGGGVSDYLVFLVPLPKAIGELRFDGKSCTFYPLKPRYFPDIGSNPVTECIGKTIRIVSDKKYEVFFRFERFNDPLIELNKLLHSIKVPEK